MNIPSFLIACGVAVLGLLPTVQAAPAPAWAPGSQLMLPGIAVVSCSSTGAPTDDVLALIDLRDPVGCGATPIGTPPNHWALTPTRVVHRPNWKLGNLGEIFGVDVDSATSLTGPGNIYISAMGMKLMWAGHQTASGGTGSGGEVFRINGTTGADTLVAALPNHRLLLNGSVSTFVGLGQVSYSSRYQTIYVSNFDDGKIYVYDVSGAGMGTQLCTFDHGQVQLSTADDPTLLFTQQNRLVFGLEYNPVTNRLFYALRNALDQDEIWSLALNSTGCPVGAPCLEFISAPFAGVATATFPGGAAATSLPCDIQFSPDGCRMLITQVTGGYDGPYPVSAEVPTIAGLQPNQRIVRRLAHASVSYECHKTSPSACGNWAYVNYYRTGTINAPALPNSVAGDYGYADLKNAPRADSIVCVAETIRGPSLGLNYGLQISALDDYSRINPFANFDMALFASPSGSPATKFQLNDVDVLHVAGCQCVIPPSVIPCPPVPGGNYTFNLSITNISSSPAFGLNLGTCPANFLPPGALPGTPMPVVLPGGILNPGATVLIPVTLTGVPITGGKVCFCAELTYNFSGIGCMDVVCMDFPDCSPPCATLSVANIQCISGTPGGYSFTLNCTNIQPVPVTSLVFSPCVPAQLPSGAITGTPSPSTVTLGSPLPNGGSTSTPVALPGLPLVGGTYCFNVTLMGASGVICTKKICVTLPACPPRCLNVSATNIKCPTIAGAPYTATLTLTNIGTNVGVAYALGACNPLLLPPGAVSITPTPSGYTPLSPVLAPGDTISLPITLPGLSCTGGTVCFCATLFGYNQQGGTSGDHGPLSSLCSEMVCVTLPACPCPPCVELVAGNIHCPEVAGGNYSMSLTIINLQPTTAFWAGLTACPANQVPPGTSTLTPIPGGIIPLTPPLTTGNSTTLSVQIPSPPSGGNICFCVTLLDQAQQVICKDRVCFTLPACGCSELLSQNAVCLSNGSYQITVSVKNNSSISGTPFPFALATFSPSLGFSPAVVAPTPNPILPAGTGTVTTTYTGASGVKCFDIIFSNANRTRCCTQRVCLNLPACTPTIGGNCKLRDQYTCEGASTKVLFSIYNPTAVPQSFNWSIAPLGMPGCVTLLPSAFAPASGTTAAIGAGGTLNLCVYVNTSGLTPGTCAGFQVCVSPKGTGQQPVTCCHSILRCPKKTDPCIIVKNPHTVISPGKIIGIPIIIKNIGTEIMNQSFVVSDAAGVLTFRYQSEKPSAVIMGGTVENDTIISDEHPLAISIEPGQQQEIMVYAEYTGARVTGIPIDIIIVGPPCVGIPLDVDIGPATPKDWGSGTVVLGTGTPIGGGGTGSTKPKDFKFQLTSGGPCLVCDGVALMLSCASTEGVAYRMQSGTGLGSWKQEPNPIVFQTVMEDDGTFWGTGGNLTLYPPPTQQPPLREFYRLQAADPPALTQ